MKVQVSIVDLSALPPYADAVVWRRECNRIYDLGREISAEAIHPEVIYLTGSRGLFMLARVAPEVPRG